MATRPGNKRRLLAVLERGLEESGAVEGGRGAHEKIGSDRRCRDAEALGAFVGGDADAAREPEHGLKSAGLDRGLALLGGHAPLQLRTLC